MAWNNRPFSVQFSVTTLLMLIVVAAVAFGWYRDHQQLTAELNRSQSLVAVLSAPKTSLGFSGSAATPRREPYLRVDELLEAVRTTTDPREFSGRTLTSFQPYEQTVTRRVMALDAIPAILPLMDDPNPAVRLRAISVLSMTGRGAKDVVPALMRALDDSDERVQYQAAVALGRYGEAAQAALPGLIEMFEAPAHPGTALLGDAIARIDPSVNVVDRLAGLLALEDDMIVETVLSALNSFDPYQLQGVALAPQIAERLQNPDDPHRAAIVRLFSRLPAQPAYEEVLLKVLETEKNASIRNAIGDVIKHWHNIEE